MDFVRLCTLASDCCSVCWRLRQVRHKEVSNPLKPLICRIGPAITIRSTSADQPATIPLRRVKIIRKIFVLWNSNGNGFPWCGLTNQSLGMTLDPADDALRAHLKLPEDQGLIVAALEFHSSAAQAGIEQNDILLQLESAALAKPADLEDNLKAAGDKAVSLKVLRGGKTLATSGSAPCSVGLGPVQREPPGFGSA